MNDAQGAILVFASIMIAGGVWWIAFVIGFQLTQIRELFDAVVKELLKRDISK